MPRQHRELPGDRRILVIEDDPDIRDLMRQVLDFEGYAVATAANGQEGLEVVAKQPVDLILLDLRMPIMDGRRFAQILSERGSRIPIVLVSADPDGQLVAEEIDAKAYLAKPFQLASLLDQVSELIGVCRMTDAP